MGPDDILCHFARFRPSKLCTPNEGSPKTVGEHKKNVQESDASSVFGQSPTSRFCPDDHFGAHRKVSCIMYLYINQTALVWRFSHRHKRINILNLASDSSFVDSHVPLSKVVGTKSSNTVGTASNAPEVFNYTITNKRLSHHITASLLLQLLTPMCVTVHCCALIRDTKSTRKMTGNEDISGTSRIHRGWANPRTM